jgi:hypothetical protein
MSAIVVPLEVGWRSFAAEIAVDALIIDIEFSIDVFRIFVCDVCHKNLRGVSASKAGRSSGTNLFLFDGTQRSDQITLSKSSQRLSLHENRHARRFTHSWVSSSFMACSSCYFFLVLHYMGDWLSRLDKQNVKLYALLCIGLIIGQAVVLEWVTTFIFRLLRGRSE